MEIFGITIGILGIIFLSLFFLLLPVIAIISILGKNTEAVNKLIWIAIVIGLPFVGSLLWFIIGTKSRSVN